MDDVGRWTWKKWLKEKLKDELKDEAIKQCVKTIDNVDNHNTPDSNPLPPGIYVETGTYNGEQYIDLEVNESVAREAYNSGKLKAGTYETEGLIVQVNVERIEGPDNNRISVTAYSK